MLVSPIALKFQISARNGQIITFEHLTLFMRHEVRVFLGALGRLVVGPCIFSFS